MPALPPDRPGSPPPSPGTPRRGHRKCAPHAPGERQPLPDPAAVRMFHIPDSAPPFDEALPAGATDRIAEPSAAAPGATVRMAGAPPLPAAALAPDARGHWTAPGPGTGSARWPNQFAQALAETLAGSRPARQMTPWTTEQVRTAIQRLGAHLGTGQRPRVRRVLTSSPAAGVMEMTVVIGFGNSVRALAVRLERVPDRLDDARAQRWLCTAVEAA
jgi:hypothetical protein